MADTIPGTVGTTAVLTAGVPVSGTIEDNFDEDWYRVTLQGGVTYLVELKGVASRSGTLEAPAVRLVSSAGEDLLFSWDFGSATEDARTLFAPPVTGEFFVEAAGLGSSGTYVLALSSDDHANAASGATPIVVGTGATGRLEYSSDPVLTSTSGTIQVRTDTDWFRVELQGSTTYRFSMRGSASGAGTVLAPGLTLTDAAGTTLVADPPTPGQDASFDYQPSGSGVYYLTATANRSVLDPPSSNTYSLLVEAIADTRPPQWLSANPADGARGVAVSSNFAFTFNEALQRGTGTIVLRAADGRLVESFDAASSDRLRFVGATLTLDPSADLAIETNYVVELPAGSVRDLAGNAFAGLNGYDITTVDPTPPVAVSLQPADGATGVDPNASVTITFSEPIQRGSGQIVIKTEAGAIVESFDAAKNFRLSYFGSKLTIDPTNSLAPGTHYSVEIPPGSVTDAAGNGYAGSAGYDFTTKHLSVRSSDPADGDSWVGLGGNLTIDFNAAVVRGSGFVTLRTADGVVLESMDAATSPRLGWSGSRLTIDPGADLRPGARYVVELAAGTALAATGGSVLSASSYEFETQRTLGQSIAGTSGFDRIVGTAADEYVDGGDGNDDLDGGPGDDVLDSGTGSSVTFRESSGNDVMIVRSGHSAFTLRVDGSAGGTNTLVAAATYLLGSPTFLDGGVTLFEYRSSIRADAVLALGAWFDKLVLTGAQDVAAIGNDHDNMMTGNAGHNMLSGFAGNDWLFGGAGNDTLDGGEGIDRAAFTGPSSNHRWVRTGDLLTVVDTTVREGVDLLSNIERLEFADRGVAFDLDGHAGSVCKILGALFGIEFLARPEYVRIGLDLLDGGMSYADVVALAVSSEAFVQLAGSRSNGDFVGFVFENVVDRAPTPAELQEFVSLLDSGAYSQASLALLACDSEVNRVHVDIVGRAASGIEFALTG